MARVESIVDKLLAKGLVVIVNVHHYHQLDGDSPETGEAFVEPAAVDVRFIMLWEQLATRFRGRSPRLVFELYNEPHGRMNGEPWNVLAARTLGVVRKTNADRIVVIGPTSWNSASNLQQLKLPNDANLIATVHDYDPFRFTHQGAEWVSPVLPLGVTCCSSSQKAEMTAALDVAKTWSSAKHYPVFVGEFGAYSKADDASRYRLQPHDARCDRDARHDLDVLGVRGWLRSVRPDEAQRPPRLARLPAGSLGVSARSVAESARSQRVVGTPARVAAMPA